MTPQGEEKYPIPQQLSQSLLVHKHSSISPTKCTSQDFTDGKHHRVTNSILSHKPTEAIDKKSASSQNYQKSEILLFLLIIIET